MSIFISYRRMDSEYVVGRIYDELCQIYGSDKVFKDFESIPIGADFEITLKNELAASDVVLVVIGKHWNEPDEHGGKPRLFESGDYVCLEVKEAFQQDISVIPILINGALHPTKDSLPEPLAKLANINSITIRKDPDFKNDLAILKTAIAPLIEDNKTNSFPPKSMMLSGAFLLVCVLAYLLLVPGIERARCEVSLNKLHQEFDILLNAYEVNRKDIRYVNRLEDLKRRLPVLSTNLREISDSCLAGNYYFQKYEILAFSYVLTSGTLAKEIKENDPDRYIKQVIEVSDEAIKVGQNLEEKIESSSLSMTVKSEKLNRLKYVIATAYAINEFLGDSSAGVSVEKYLNSIDPSYLKMYPLESDTFLNFHKENYHVSN